jgi:hypothetical protein
VRVQLQRSSVSAYIITKLFHSIVKSRHVISVLFKLRVNVDLISVSVDRVNGLAGLYKVV